MLKEKINVGIVGLGYAKQVLIPALEETNLFNIIGLSDSKETYQTLKILDIDYSKVPWSELIKNSKVDLILISVPAKLHTKFTNEALEHGKKVFCEKPFGDLRDIQAVHKKNLPIPENRIYVGYQFRFDPMILELYKILLTSNINQKIVINVDWISDGGKRFLNNNLQPNNIWLDFGSHIFDYLNFLGSTRSWGPLTVLEQGQTCVEHFEFPELCNGVKLIGKNVLVNISLCRISNQTPRHFIQLLFENGNIYFVEQRFPFKLRNYISSRNLEVKIPKEQKSSDIRIFDEIQQFKEIWKELTFKKSSKLLADQISAVKVHDIIKQILFPSSKNAGAIES